MDKINYEIQRINRAPYVALLWSAMMPGFGQLYNNDYLLAGLFLAFEILFNVLASINLEIVQSFNPFFYANKSLSLNLGWALFYPGLYTFSMWQAYNKAVEINARAQGTTECVTPKFTGLFICMTIGMQFGLIWPLFSSPLLTGLGYGIIGAIVGNLLEKYLINKNYAKKPLTIENGTNRITSFQDINFSLEKTVGKCRGLEDVFNGFQYVYIFDSECRYIFASANAVDYLRLKKEDIIGKHWRELRLPKQTMEAFEAALQQVIHKKKAIRGETRVTYKPLEEVRYYEYILTPLTYEADKVSTVLCIARDFTTNKLSSASCKKKASKNIG